MSGRARDLERLRRALDAAATALRRHMGGKVAYTIKEGHGPVTAADRELDDLLRTMLPEPGEGWLSEETIDDPARLSCRRVWIVDPIDGTKSFVAGRPEYAISIALVEDGEPVLGGVCNPAAGVTVTGGREVDGCRLRQDVGRGEPARGTAARPGLGDRFRPVGRRQHGDAVPRRALQPRQWRRAGCGSAVLLLGRIDTQLARALHEGR